VFHFFRSNIQL